MLCKGTTLTDVTIILYRPASFHRSSSPLFHRIYFGPIDSCPAVTTLQVHTSFYINLPVGAVTIVIIWLLLPVPHQPLASLPLSQKLDEIDFLGAFFLIP